MRGSRKGIRAASLLVVCGLLLAAGGVFQPVMSQTPGPIVIGAVVSLTGRDAAFGKECLAGLIAAIAEANSQGGVHNRLLVIETYDDRSNPILAAEGVRVLVRDHHPIAIVGSSTSMVTSAAAVAAQAVGVPLIVPEATNPAITSIGDWVYRVCFVDPDMARGLAAFAYQDLGLRKVAILLEEKHDYTQSLARHFADHFTNFGGEVIAQKTYREGARDFDDALRQFAERKADAVLVSGFYPEAGTVIAAARRLGLDVTFLGGDGWESSELFAAAGGAIDENSRIYIASHFSADVKRAKVRGFVANFSDVNGHRPNTSSALGFDAGGVVIEAVTRTRTPVPESLRSALQGVIYEGVTGRIAIDSTRNTTKNVIILQARPDRRFAFVKAVSAVKQAPAGSADEESHP